MSHQIDLTTRCFTAREGFLSGDQELDVINIIDFGKGHKPVSPLKAKTRKRVTPILYRYPGGFSALIERLIPPYITATGPEQPTIDDALESLREHFTEREAQGIRLMVREGEYLRYTEDQKRLGQQETISRVQRLLKGIDLQALSAWR